MIRQIRPTVPSGCQVFGGLYYSPDNGSLGEDMLEVMLPNGILVAAGWYPECDPNGSYKIVATEGFDYVYPPRTTNSVTDAKSIVEDFVRMLNDGDMLTYSTSAGSRVPVYVA